MPPHTPFCQKMTVQNIRKRIKHTETMKNKNMKEGIDTRTTLWNMKKAGRIMTGPEGTTTIDVITIVAIMTEEGIMKEGETTTEIIMKGTGGIIEGETMIEEAENTKGEGEITNEEAEITKGETMIEEEGIMTETITKGIKRIEETE